MCSLPLTLVRARAERGCNALPLLAHAREAACGARGRWHGLKARHLCAEGRVRGAQAASVARPVDLLELGPRREALLEGACGAGHHEVQVREREVAHSLHVAALAAGGALRERAAKRRRDALAWSAELRAGLSMHEVRRGHQAAETGGFRAQGLGARVLHGAELFVECMHKEDAELVCVLLLVRAEQRPETIGLRDARERRLQLARHEDTAIRIGRIEGHQECAQRIRDGGRHVPVLGHARGIIEVVGEEREAAEALHDTVEEAVHVRIDKAAVVGRGMGWRALKRARTRVVRQVRARRSAGTRRRAKEAQGVPGAEHVCAPEKVHDEGEGAYKRRSGDTPVNVDLSSRRLVRVRRRRHAASPSSAAFDARPEISGVVWRSPAAAAAPVELAPARDTGMGLLSLGTPLAWPDARELSEHVRVHGIEQFLAIWRRLRERHGDAPLWGDELEYMVVALDPEQKTARLSLRQGEILQRLAQCRGADVPGASSADLPTFHPEYGRYMIESTPGRPFGVSADELLRVERDMLVRRRLTRERLRPNEVPMTIGSFPRLGVTDTAFTDPPHEAHGTASHSLFLPDEIINTHVRFPTLTANIRQRRGSKVRINVPIFRDSHTPRPFVDPTIPWERDLFAEDSEAREGAAWADHIYMDAMGFGMGCCCLQVTFQAASMDEARKLYDQLVPLTPLFLAASAASPTYRGYLGDVDARWDVISAAVDDRTPVERGEAPLAAAGTPGAHNSNTQARRLRKSRYGSVDSYLGANDAARACNDVPLEVNERVEQRLREAGVDAVLAAHVGHLFVRDPLVIFSENVDLDDTTSVDHFENLQSTNWQTMRFKPPPPGDSIGWRVEFRPMEIQLTDFENAAFSVCIALLTRVILELGVDWYMPISLVDENLQRAQRRDAVHTQRFHFRRGDAPATHEYTLAELFHGTDDLPGLLPLVRRYLDTQPLEAAQRAALDEYLDLVGARADGRLMTNAAYIRQFVRSHAAYRHDSVVSDEINYDLLSTLDAIERGEKEAPGLLPAGFAARRRGI